LSLFVARKSGVLGFGRKARRLGLTRRIYPRGSTDFTREGIFALGSLPLWGNSQFDFKVRSLSGVTPKPPFSPILDSTGRLLLPQQRRPLSPRVTSGAEPMYRDTMCSTDCSQDASGYPVGPPFFEVCYTFFPSDLGCSIPWYHASFWPNSVVRSLLASRRTASLASSWG